MLTKSFRRWAPAPNFFYRKPCFHVIIVTRHYSSNSWRVWKQIRKSARFSYQLLLTDPNGIFFILLKNKIYGRDYFKSTDDETLSLRKFYFRTYSPEINIFIGQLLKICLPAAMAFILMNRGVGLVLNRKCGTKWGTSDTRLHQTSMATTIMDNFNQKKYEDAVSSVPASLHPGVQSLQWRRYNYLLCRLCKAQGSQAVRGPGGHGNFP